MSDDITLSPFQKRCIQREDNRIVLQPRRTGSTVMQAHLAADRGGDEGVLHLAPDAGSRDAFRDALPVAAPPNRIRTFCAEEKSAKGQNVSTLIVDQPQHIDGEFFRMIYTPIMMTRPEEVEVVLAATGCSDGQEETALDVAMKSRAFSLIWTDLIEGLIHGDFHNDARDVGESIERLVPPVRRQSKDQTQPQHQT